MGAQLSVVDNNLHEVEVDGRSFIFHIPSTSLFERDQLTGDILSVLRGGENLNRHGLVQALCDDYPAQEVEAALGELQSLELVSDGELAATQVPRLQFDKFPLTTVVLNVNTGCNLSCTYCYKEDLDVPAAGKKMSFDTARESIEMLLAESPDQPRYNIVFFGGEPLITPPVSKHEVKGTELHVSVRFDKGPQAKSGRIWWIYDRAPAGSAPFLHVQIPEDQWMDMGRDVTTGAWTATIPLKKGASRIEFFSNHGRMVNGYQQYLSSPYTRVELSPSRK